MYNEIKKKKEKDILHIIRKRIFQYIIYYILSTHNYRIEIIQNF